MGVCVYRTDFFPARIKVKCFEGRATDALEEYFEPRVSQFLAVKICLEKLRG